ncbi:MAG: hypothetical protein AAGI72_05085 [Pseudomonadota bacterium]
MAWVRLSGQSISMDALREQIENIGGFTDLVEALPDVLRTKFEELRAAVVESDALALIDELRDELRAAVNLEDLVAMLALEDHLWTKTDEVLDAISDAGLDTDGLKKAISSARSSLGRIPDKYFHLLRHVDAYAEKTPGQNPGLVEWTVDGSLTEDAEPARDLALNLAANGAGTLQLEAGHLFPFPAADSRYLRIGLSGEVDLGASGSLPLRLGSLGAGAGAGAALRVNYMSRTTTRSGNFAREAATGLGAVVNPLDLPDLLAHMTSGRLAGMTLAAQGEAFLNSAVGLTPPTRLVGLVNVGAALSVDAEVRVAGAYSVTARPEGSNAIVVDVRTRTSRASTIGSSLSVTLNASQLAAHLKTELEPAVAELVSALGRVDRLLQPGELLRTRIRERVGSLVADDSLKAMLRMAFGDVSDAEVKRLLSERIQGFLDTQAIVWDENAKEAAGAGIAWLTDRYPALNHPKLVTKLDGILEDAAESLQNKVQEEVQKLSARKIDALLAALKRAGIKLQEEVAPVDAALAGVRRALSNHASRAGAFLQKAEELALADLQMQFSSRRTSIAGSSLLATATFSSASKGASALYRALIRGDIDALTGALDSPVAGADIQLREWQRFAEFRKMQGFSLVIFDLKLNAETVFSNKATVGVDQSGALSVLASTEWQRRRRSRREEQKFLFTSVYSLVAAKLTRSFSANISLVQSDQQTSGDELEAFLRGLERHELIAPGVTDSALSLVPAHALSSVVSVEMQIDHDALMRLLFMHENSQSFRKDTIARLALEALLDSGSLSEESYTVGYQALREGYFGVTPGMAPEEVLLALKRNSQHKLFMSRIAGSRKITQAVEDWCDAQRKALALFRMLSAMRKIMREEPGDGAASREDLEKWYQKRQKPIDDALKHWLVIDGTLFNWVSDRISAEAIAFLTLIDRLSASSEIAAFPMQSYLQLDSGPRRALPV